MQLSSGSVLDDRFTLESLLGSGGMAEVWRARRLGGGPKVAVKVLRVSTTDLVARLLLEGRLQSRLDHPNIVRVIDTVELPGGVALVMELVEGPTLRDLLDGVAEGREELPLADRFELGDALLAGVEHAHQQGLIHRDLKPANVLLQPVGDRYTPRVMDFGLARALEEDDDGARRTRTGMGMGTPGYMAPEQFRDASRADQRADVFSLGVILYELLTGRVPFRGANVLTLYQQALSGSFTDPRALNPALSQLAAGLLYKALRPRADERFHDAGHLRAQWRRAASSESDETFPPGSFSLPELSEDTFPTLDLLLDEEPSLAGPFHNLPELQDRFFGRRDALASLRSTLVGGGRLLTVLGSGGLGKTRLALEFARDALEEFNGGVWFCDLTESRTVEGVCLPVARALGVPLGKEDPVQTLGRALTARSARGRVLLVLDNFEQVVQHAPQTVGEWQRAAPGVVFLVTSRARLGLRHEQLLALEPLTLPAPGERRVEVLADNPAVALFVERTQARTPGFVLSERNAGAVAELVGLLDGLPLAIELAAARARMVSPATMVSRMGQRFRLLSGDRRDVSARQATLRGAIDWSWELLDPWEKAAFAQCSAFEGGFTLEAAEAVLDLEGVDCDGEPPWPMDVVQSLADKSLLRALRGAGPDGQPRDEPRFGMFLSLKQYAAEKLQGEERQNIRARHSAYFAGFGTPEALEALRTHGGEHRWWALSEDLENLVAAVEAAAGSGEVGSATAAAEAAVRVIARQGPPAAAETVLAQLQALEARGAAPGEARGALRLVQGQLHKLAARMDEARGCFEDALERARGDGDRRLMGRALSALGELHVSLTRGAEGRRCAQEALAIHRALGDRLAEAGDLATLGIAHRVLGEMGEARGRLKAALKIYRELGDRHAEGKTLGDLGTARRLAGELDEAAALTEGALKLYRALGDQRLQAVGLVVLGDLHRLRGRPEDAERALQASLALARGLGDPFRIGGALLTLGTLSLSRARHEEAEERFQQALALARQSGAREREGVIHGNLGVIALRRSDPLGARDRFLAVQEIARELGDPRLEGSALANLGIIATSLGDYQAAQDHYSAALALHRAIEDRPAEGAILSRLGRLHQQQGRLAEARASIERSLEIQRETRSRLYEGHSLMMLANVSSAEGKLEETLAHRQEALAIFREVGNTYLAGQLLCQLGDLLGTMGEQERARAHFAEALETLAPLDAHQLKAVATSRLGLTRLRLGEGEGEALVTRATELLTEQGDRMALAELHLLRGNLAVEQGDRPRASAALAEVARLAAEIPIPDGHVLLRDLKLCRQALNDLEGPDRR
jgi:predicted ATPase/Tfp pilus assembly protein PilF